MEAPALKMPCATARSLTGNHSALALVAPGQLPASPRPMTKRMALNAKTLRITACSATATDHTMMASTKPMRVPMASMILPNAVLPIK